MEDTMTHMELLLHIVKLDNALNEAEKLLLDVYTAKGNEEWFDALDDWMGRADNLRSWGRDARRKERSA
jgi:hypothetical protein